MKRPEEALHRAMVAHLRARLPKPWIVFHVPNGAGRSKAEAGILKAMGVLAGMPDLFVMGPPPQDIELSPGVVLTTNRKASLVAIELKAPPRRLRSGRLSNAKPRLSPAQRSLQADLGACGVPVLVVDDLDKGMAALIALGVPVRGRAP